MPSEYERKRDEQVARNKALLASLMRDCAQAPIARPVEEVTPRVKRVKEAQEPSRRSSRARGIQAEDHGELPDDEERPTPPPKAKKPYAPSTKPTKPSKSGFNSKTFGAPSTAVGKTWPGRRGPHDAGVHTGLVRGSLHRW